MPGENRRETGDRIPHEKSRRDSNDDVPQEAAENKKPGHRGGLADQGSDRSESDRSDLAQRPTAAKDVRSSRNG
jgi:hypothetical protein